MGASLPQSIQPAVGFFALNGQDTQTEACRNLWAAVLQQAVTEFRQGRQPALRIWVQSHDQRPCSFEWLCHVVGLEVERVRSKLLAEKPEGRYRKQRSDAVRTITPEIRRPNRKRRAFQPMEAMA